LFPSETPSGGLLYLETPSGGLLYLVISERFLEQKRNDLSFHLIAERNQIILYIIKQDLSVYFISISSYLFAFSNMNSFIISSND